MGGVIVFEGFEWTVSCLRGLSGRCHCVLGV